MGQAYEPNTVNLLLDDVQVVVVENTEILPVTCGAYFTPEVSFE